jgi:nitrate/nitrite transporter NarK
VATDSGKIVVQYVVNAAFNSGNSGGPLIQIESGDVIGVVVSKLAPISPSTMSALKALQTTSSGFTYTVTAPDGTKSQLVEGQVIAMVLDDLRKQVQLVIGRAGMIGDLRSFLTANKITP